MAVKLQKAEEEMRIEKQKLKERVLQIESMMGAADAEVRKTSFVTHSITVLIYSWGTTIHISISINGSMKKGQVCTPTQKEPL